MGTTTISSVEVINFMCHTNLKISFDKMITCIGGRNGSGKSAIMMALGMIFGQSAKDLERGNSLKTFIKTGTNQAIVRVVINNHRKYNLERYGEFITIEKKIREKETKLSIANKFGKIFKVKKSELEGIIEAYNLKFDNPLNFLTQEGSKKFLNVSSPTHLYDFYYLGTEFKELDQDLIKSKDLLDELQEKIEEASQQIAILDEKLTELNAELKFHEYEADAELQKLSYEEVWLDITNKMKNLENIREQIKELEENKEMKEKQRDEYREDLNQFFEEKSTVELETQLSKTTVQHHNVQSEILEYSQELESIKNSLEQAENKNNTNELQRKISRLKESVDSRKLYLEEIEGKKDNVYQEMLNEQENNKIKNEKIFSLKKQIEYLKLNAFDQSKNTTIEAVKRIKDELKKHKFTDSVIGPVYEYIELKDPLWYKVASLVLKKSLSNFIVFNNEDKIKLYDIFNKLKVDFSVSQMKSKRAYKNLNTNKDYISLLDVLEIKNDVVSNQLITLYSVEQMILIDRREKAHEVILRDPKNVECAYVPTGDRIKLVNGSLTDFRQRDDGSFWFEDKSSKIGKYERELSQIEVNDKYKQEYNKIMYEMGIATNEIEQNEKKIRNMQFELSALSNLKENDTDGLAKKLKVLGNTIRTLENKRQTLETTMNSLNQEINEIKEINRISKEKIKKIKEKGQSEMARIDSDLMIINNKKGLLTTQANELEGKIQIIQSAAGERPEIIRDLATIARERKVAYEFKERMKTATPKEQILKSVEQYDTKRRSIATIKEKFEMSLEETKAAYDKRVVKKEEIKNRNTELAVQAFREYTARSGYEGIMEIDHEHKLLDLKMKVHNSTIAGSKNTLSGGERSFAGVCFLLSMWKCFKCPVKVMDEFDVFMDTLNRKTIIRAIFEFFKENDTQVILITPLDTADLEDPECDIKLMKKDGL